MTFTDARPDHKRFGAAVGKKNNSLVWFNYARSMMVAVKMGAPKPGRQGPGKQAVVAFDFDGTLTYRDSFHAFLAWRAGPLRLLFGLARLAPAIFVYLKDRDRGRLKAAAVRTFLHGLSREELERSCAAFALSRIGEGLIRPDAEQRWAEWRASGATMVIVTASPEQVVAPFAERLGADLLIGTLLEFDRAGRVTGSLDGRNCRNQEKVVRLRAHFGPKLRLAAAYGDSDGDREMLALADVAGYRVFTGRPGREA